MLFKTITQQMNKTRIISQNIKPFDIIIITNVNQYKQALFKSIFNTNITIVKTTPLYSRGEPEYLAKYK